MNHVNFRLNRDASNELQRIIEPLANYICATSHPREALLTVLAAIRHEVETTNRAARCHFRTYSEN